MNTKNMFGLKKFNLVWTLFFLLVLSTNVFAAVTISPTNPTDNDPLTCYVNGITTGFTVDWEGTGVTIQGTHTNPLQPTNTIPGTVTCEAWKQGTSTKIWLGNATINILSIPTNTRPYYNPLLPDVTIVQDSGLNQNLLNIWNSAHDAETQNNQLYYTIFSQSNTAIVSCVIRPTTNGAWLDCTTQPGQNGYSDLVIRVSDGQLFAEDTVRVTVTPIVVNSQCSDGIDNDGDSYIDLLDSGCANAADNDETNPIFQCNDGLDNDNDGLIDLLDSGCSSLTDNDETNVVTTQCSDSIDNDADTLIDLADPGCTNAADTDETNTVTTQCSDSIDNDGDSYIDLLDSGCSSLTDNDETNTIVSQCSNGLDDDNDGYIDLNDFGCTDANDNNENNNGATQCSDGIDNDADSYIDQVDPGCTSAIDTDETNAGPNTTPIINPAIPDVRIMENSGLNSNLINLWNYVNDVETSDAQLTYTIVRETNTGVVDCSIDANQYISCTTQQNQFGQSDVTIRISDGQGYAEDVFTVTVVYLNNPPTLTELPDRNVEEDSGLNERLIDLWGYASDIESQDHDLLFTIVSETNPGIVDCEIEHNIIFGDDNRWIECTTGLNQVGSSDVTIRVTDVGGFYAEGSFTITVNPVNDAPIVSTISPVQMYEDMPETAKPQIDLDDFVSDVDNTPAEMHWTVSSDKPGIVDATINADNTLSYDLAQDYFGHATLTVTACDLENVCDLETIFVTIVPMNDAPIVNIPDTTINFNEDTVYTTTWSLEDYVTDVDNTLDEISWTYSGNNFIQVKINNDKTITFTAPTNWNGGPETIIFTATDIGNLFGTDSISVTVDPVNDAPVLDEIHDITIDEDTIYTITAIDSYVSDVEDSFDQLEWSALVSTNIDVEFNTITKTITFTPIENWFGEEEITITVTDSQGLTDSETFTVTVRSINDLPWIEDSLENPIPNQVADEDATPWTLNLADYENDIEDTDSDLVWSVSGVNTELFTTSFDSNLNVITFTPVANACGTDDVTLTLTDSDAGIATQDITVTLNCVNDAPIINPVIPNQFKIEGSAPWGIDLDKYGFDVEDAQEDLVWSVADVDPTLLIVNIDPVTHIAIFQLVNSDVKGIDTISFTLTDSEGASISQNVLVTIDDKNDAPIVSDIPDVTFDEDTTTTLDLNDYVSDVDNLDSEMDWTTEGNDNIIISIVDGIATFSAPGNWSGQEIVTLQACDLEPLCSSTQIIVKVNPINDAPIVTIAPFTLTFDEDTMGSVNLNDFVTDVDNTDAQIRWTYSGNINIAVNIVANNVAVFTPKKDWNGPETITFTAYDLGQDGTANTADDLYDSDDLPVTVTPVNDLPVITTLPDVTFDEDVIYTTTWSLNDYVSDVDGDTISWSASTSLSKGIVINGDGTITFTPNLDYFGYEDIIFTANDGHDGIVLDQIVVAVNPINDAPIVTDIPNQNIPEDSVYHFVDLDDYVSDIENTDAELRWTYSGNSKIKVDINPTTHEVLLIPDTNYIGSETITFTACDWGADNLPSNADDLCDSDDSLITVEEVGDIPVITPIPDILNVLEDTVYTTPWSLDDYVADPDTLDTNIEWTFTDVDTSLITVTKDPLTRKVVVTPILANWHGVEFVTFTACGTAIPLCVSDEVMIVVNSVNDKPWIDPTIGNQVKSEDDSAWTLDLETYGHDFEDDQEDLVWSVDVSTIDTTIYTAAFDATNKIITFTPISNKCTATPDTITLTVTDTEGLFASQDITVNIACENDIPVISDIPNIQLQENSPPITLLNLNSFITDVENTDAEIKWTASTSTPIPHIQIVINPTTHDVTFSLINPEWTGQEPFTFTACDWGADNLPSNADDACVSDEVIVYVNSVNDAPIVNNIPDVTFNEDMSTTLDLNLYVSDVDNLDSEMTWTATGATNIIVSINPVTKIATFSALQDWNGAEPITLQACDLEPLCDTDNIIVTVNPVNDDPIVTDIPDLTMTEDSVVTSIDLDDYVSDIDNTDAQITWTTSGNTNIGVSINPTTHVVTFTPAHDWSGVEPITFIANDGNGGTDSDVSIVTVTPVADYKVVINEFVSYTPEWIELYNPEPVDVDLSTWTIEDGTGNHNHLTGTIASHGFKLLNKGAGLDFTFALNDGGDIIILREESTLIIDQVTYGTWDDGNTADNAPTPLATPTPFSVGRLPDGDDTDVDNIDFKIINPVTPETSNDGLGLDSIAPTILSIIPTMESMVPSPVTISATTNENANCEYSTNSNFVYGTGTDFPTTGGLIHSVILVLTAGSPIYTPGDCDLNGIIEIPDVSCMNEIIADPTLCSGTYDCSNMDVDFDGNYDADDLAIVTGLVDNPIPGIYTYYIKCQDGAGNSNTDVNQGITQFKVITGSTICSDGIDNDGDSFVDLADFGCTDASDNNEINNGVTQCSDGIDNGDTEDILIDQNDPGCVNAADNDETNLIFQCSDGIDNGDPEDTLIDMADPGCSSLTDNDETNSVANNPPTITSVSLSPDSVLIDGTLTCNVIYSNPDVDGDPVTLTYAWTTTGAYSLAAFTGSTLDLSLVAGEVVGNVITCTATANDGNGGTDIDSDSSTITTSVPGPAALSGYVRDGINNNLYHTLVELKQGTTTIATYSTDGYPDVTNVGYYTFSGLTAGNYNLVVSKSGFTTSAPLAVTLISGANTQNLNIFPDPALSGVISGTVKDMSNNGIADAYVIVRQSLTNQVLQVVKADSSGNYVVTGLLSGLPYKLEAQKIGYSFLFGPTNIGVIVGTVTTNQNIFMII
ncbi:MAG: tandem-95 repeat protein [Candidatus Nanoarchaeia archaeon]